MDPILESMYEHFTTNWDLGVDAIIPGGIEIRYQGNIYKEDPDRNAYWARLSTVYTRSEQATLSNSVINPGSKRYKTTGIVFLQVFGPRHQPGAWNTCDALAKLGQKVFRQYVSTGNVWYNNATVENLPYEENWLRFNTSARFTYDEFS
jgi:hypothetical protein